MCLPNVFLFSPVMLPPAWIISEMDATAKSPQSCPTLCDPIDSSPQGSLIPGILQARTLEWVAISFSNAWKWKVKVKSLSCVQPLATLWTAAHQAPPSMGFSRQEYWSGVPLSSPQKWIDYGLTWFFLVSNNIYLSVSEIITGGPIIIWHSAYILALNIIQAMWDFRGIFQSWDHSIMTKEWL